MRYGAIIKAARKRAGLTLQELGSLVNFSASQLCEIENDKTKTPPSPVDMVRIAEALFDTTLLHDYCNRCPIRSKIIIKKFPPLNNINTEPAVMAMKVMDKLAVAADTLQPMLRKMLARDFRNDPEYTEYRNTAILKILDVKRGTEILLDEFAAQGVVSMAELRTLVDMQQRLCEEHGHHIPLKDGK